jgi:ABC-type cobalamin/Fe3+-siderophores transport system ATPase subunit
MEGTTEYRGKQIRNTLAGVFHDLGEAARLCRRGVFVKDGRIVSDVDLKDAFNSKVLNEVYDFDVISYKRTESAFWNS